MYNQQLIPRPGPEPVELRLQRRAARLQRRHQHLRARLILWCTISASIALLGVIGFVYMQIQSILASSSAYPTIDGIPCQPATQTGYHVHIHLTIYVNGRRVTIPQGVGFPPDMSCFYWMHTHTSDGIIHIEAPARNSNLTLNNFLTIWHDRFANMGFPRELNQATGWTLYINGEPFSSQLASPLTTTVQLRSHDIVTLEYGSHNPPPDSLANYKFPVSLPT